MNSIYLDNNSTTPIDPRVLSAMNDILLNYPGNPSSVHSYGQKTRQRLIEARDTVAGCLGVSPKELVFTSGATEAINMAIRSFFETSPKGHLITSDLEHEAVYQTIRQIEKRGCSVTYLKGGAYGAVSPESVQAAIRPDTKLIALIGVNNETGVKTDVDAIAEIAKEANIPLFIDAVAMLGKEQIRIPEGVSSMCFSGHKIHAPQGVGLLFMRRQFKIVPLLHGGSQEGGRRAGTENMAGIVGLAKAFELLDLEHPEAIRKMEALRDYFEDTLKSRFEYIAINGAGPRTCNTSNLAFKGIDGEALLARLDLEGVAVSLGSACTSGALEPSRVLLNMGIAPDVARSSIRFSLSRMTTREDIDRAITIILKELT